MLPKPRFQRYVSEFALAFLVALDRFNTSVRQHKRPPLTPIEQFDNVPDAFLVSFDDVVPGGYEVAHGNLQCLVDR
jgi:hypothetical protein